MFQHIFVLVASVAALSLPVVTPPALAMQDGVAAVVNSQIITKSELNQAVALTGREMGRSLSDAEQQALQGRLLMQLIDNELKRQHAQSLGFNTSAAELEAAATRLAEVNNMAPEALRDAVGSDLKDVFEARLKADVLWQKVLAGSVRANVTVSNAEVDQLIRDMTRTSFVTERELSQIFMAVPDSTQEQTVLEQLETVKAQLEAGEPFATLARAYSDDRTAFQGGYMGWFAAGELAPAIASAVDALEPGQIRPPVRSPLGWHLIKLERQRKTQPMSLDPVQQLRVVELAVPAETANARKLLAEMAAEVLENPGSPLPAQTAEAPFTNSRDWGWMSITDLPAALQSAVEGTRTGSSSKMFEADNLARMVVVTGERRFVSDKLQEYRERVRNHLLENRMEQASRRLLRDLRQRAFIDVKL